MKLPAPSFRSSSLQPRGAALVMSLLVISMMAALVLLLFQSINTEARAGRAYTNAYRADLALDAAVAEVTRKFLVATPPHGGDFIIVPSNDDSKAIYLSYFADEKWQYEPLFSGSVPVTPTDDPTAPPVALQRDIPEGLTDALNQHYETLTGQEGLADEAVDPLYPPAPFWMENRPQSAMEYVEFPTGEVSADSREITAHGMLFCYWLEDMGAYVDGDVAGNDNGTAQTHLRDKGNDPSEIALFTVLDDAPESVEYPDSTTMLAAHRNENNKPLAAKFLAARKAGYVDLDKIFPYDPALPTDSPANEIALLARRNIAFGAQEYELDKVVPRGFGYPDEDAEKKDLNEFVANGDVDGLAEYIKRNLPEFHKRSSQLHSDYDYYKSLAANIIDYADDDSNSSSGAGYRGLDSFPLVSKFYDRYSYLSRPDNFTIIVEVESWVELWNQGDKAATGDVRIVDNNRRILNGFLLSDITTPEFSLGTQTLQPNEFRVLRLGKTEYKLTYTSPFTAPTTSAPLVFSNTAPSLNPDGNTTFKLYWNNTLVDFCRGGLQNNGFTFPQLSFTNNNSSTSNWRWLGMANPHLHLSGGQVSDPRANIYIHGTTGVSGSESYVHHRTYASNVCWGSRNVTTTGTQDYRTVYHSIWGDGGFHRIGVGPTAGTNSKTPFSDTRPALISAVQNPNLFVTRFSNTGSYTNLGELGHVFDPIHRSGLNQQDGFQAEASKACGGNSLRVGRTEHFPLHQDGLRASELLNLFRLENHKITKGKINVNTASRDVLRALFAGVILESDNAAVKNLDIANAGYKTGYALYPPSEQKPADTLADALILARQEKPFRTLSDVSDAMKPGAGNKSENGIFGNPLLWPNVGAMDGKAPITWQNLTGELVATANVSKDLAYHAMSDACREELFRRTSPLMTTTSRNFRLYATGMAVVKRGTGGNARYEIVGTSSMTAKLFVNTDFESNQTRLEIHEKQLH